MSIPSSPVAFAKLSPVMEKALASARNSPTRRLYRWPGGYWMPRMRAEGEISPDQGTYHGTQTVRGLLSRGLLVPVEKMTGGDPWVVEVRASDVITGQPLSS